MSSNHQLEIECEEDTFYCVQCDLENVRCYETHRYNSTHDQPVIIYAPSGWSIFSKISLHRNDKILTFITYPDAILESDHTLPLNWVLG